MPDLDLISGRPLQRRRNKKRFCKEKFQEIFPKDAASVLCGCREMALPGCCLLCDLAFKDSSFYFLFSSMYGFFFLYTCVDYVPNFFPFSFSLQVSVSTCVVLVFSRIFGKCSS